jgi:ribulose-5-phosphate 4-epimerase/fuculose-1-phosphate aldolase
MSQAAGTIPEARARRLLAASSAIQYRLGLTDYLGHTSMRSPDPGLYLVKPKHSRTVRAGDTVAPEDFILVDDDGRLVRGGDAPPSEVFIHTEIYKRRPDVQVVIHTHQPLATLMGVLDAPILPLLHAQAPLVEVPPPVWPCSLLVQDPGLGAELATALGDAAVGHLQGHGIVSVAATIEEATVNALHLEQLAKANLEVLKTGRTPRVVPPEQIARLRTQLSGVAGRWAYYAAAAEVDDALLE